MDQGEPFGRAQAEQGGTPESRLTGPDGQIDSERIEEIDQKVPEPKLRAEKIWYVLQQEQEVELSQYDIICFCVQFLAQLAIGPFNGDEDFVTLVRNLNRWLHQYHYLHSEEIFTDIREDESNG